MAQDKRACVSRLIIAASAYLELRLWARLDFSSKSIFGRLTFPRRLEGRRYASLKCVRTLNPEARWKGVGSALAHRPQFAHGAKQKRCRQAEDDNAVHAFDCTEESPVVRQFDRFVPIACQSVQRIEG